MALSEHFSIKMSNGEAPPKLHRGANIGLYVLLSRTQAGPGRAVKQEQEEISRNHVPRLFLGSVHVIRLLLSFLVPIVIMSQHITSPPFQYDNTLKFGNTFAMVFISMQFWLWKELLNQVYP